MCSLTVEFPLGLEGEAAVRSTRQVATTRPASIREREISPNWDYECNFYNSSAKFGAGRRDIVDRADRGIVQQEVSLPLCLPK
jgi:hypothetical protein